MVLRIHYSNKNMLFDFYSAQFSPCRTFFFCKIYAIYFPEKELTTFKYHLFSCVLWFAKYLQRHELQAFFDSHFQVLLFALLRRLKYPFVNVANACATKSNFSQKYLVHEQTSNPLIVYNRSFKKVFILL